MKINRLKPRKALNKAFLKVKPIRIEIERFKSNLIQLLDRTNDRESEEFHKNLVIDFLKKTYYDPHHFINTKGRNDLVIHIGDKAKSSVGVIIEAKKPTNKSEMVTTEKLNAKAFQELVLYYLRERITLKNLEVKHLVITNMNEWFIFNATTFDRLFAQNKRLLKQFNDFEGGRLTGTKTDFFYKQIAEPFIEDVEAEIEYTYFNLQDYQKPLRNNNKADDNKLIALFKLLSPEHLLKLPFINDSNSLNESFYKELLEIVGLKQTKVGGKKLIERNKEGERNSGSILEDCIIQLDSLDKISRLKNPGLYGNTHQERLFNVALELTITWINRILFLKLLEAQLITYHKGDTSYSFLNLKKIKNYDDLNSLFFEVLARKHDDRNADVKHIFETVPYLNSSLFEPTELEHSTLVISNLKDDKTLPINSSTVLKNDQGKKRTGRSLTLEYLFEFLDAYDFSSEGAEDIQEDNKTLINASVLGLIFEKINGYKDGSIFTPGFITMYMSRETIRKAVVQKFNEDRGWNCKSFEELKEDLQEEIKSGNRKEVRKLANKIINSLKIIDPAVGSGHFLVSVLNELIAIKCELRILVDADYEPLSFYTVEVVNDELIVTDEDGLLYKYNPKNKESQRIQETLFHEKQTIIENCLFGVDINPNSVKICRLRLWIELLKNAYYKNATELETLPNIDINIKCGNSLVSRFAIDSDLKQALRKSKWTIQSYRNAVDTYRNAHSKEQKKEMKKLISDIKSDFRSEISKNDPKVKKRDTLLFELHQLTKQQQLFEMTNKEKAAWNKRVDELTQETKKLEIEIEDIKANKIFENAFEWRFEFPEVLNDDGNFVGFDMVIGNPPYIRQEEFSEMKGYLSNSYQTFTGTADIYVYFVELGIRLLKNKGAFTFIIPNKWMRTSYGKKLRQYLKTKELIRIIDFGDLPVFEEATTYPIIIQMRNNTASKIFKGLTADTLNFEFGLGQYVSENEIEILVEGLQDDNWSLIDRNSQKLLLKLRSKGEPLGKYVGDNIYYGIKTGFNEAFVIDRETKEKLIEADPNSEEIIKPFLSGRDIKRYQKPLIEKYLILFPKGFTIKRNLPEDDPIHLGMVREPPPRYGYMEYNAAWDWIKTNYSAIAEQLLPYKAKAEKRTDQGDFWWELRACDYYSEFEKPKIMLPDISKRAEGILDLSGCYCVNTAYIIPKEDLYLLGLLNSSTVHFFYLGLTSSIRGGYLRFIRQYMEQIPIPNGETFMRNKVETLVNQILKLRKQNPQAETADLEGQIDQLVYQLYGLSDEEIEIVESSSK